MSLLMAPHMYGSKTSAIPSREAFSRTTCCGEIWAAGELLDPLLGGGSPSIEGHPDVSVGLWGCICVTGISIPVTVLVNVQRNSS
jgi:hypothetical protein